MRLPLFPLGLVLFPGLVLPLHVFEERYRQLVRELVALPADEPRRFGVIAIRQGRETGVDGVGALYEIGCTAQLRHVQPYEDGRFDIVTVGTQRFALTGVDDSLPYLQGDVELLADETGAPTEAKMLVAPVQAAFTAYLTMLTEQGVAEVRVPELPDEPVLLSYLVAATIIADLAVQQTLLAEPDATRRLRSALAVLRKEAAILRRLTSAPAPGLARSPISLN